MQIGMTPLIICLYLPKHKLRYYFNNSKSYKSEVIAKALDLLTDGKADAFVRRILGLVFGGRGRPPCHV